MRALLAVAVIATGAVTGLSCSVNDYCLQCATGDGGIGSGDGGGSGSDGDIGDSGGGDGGCVPTGAEECDGKDNDCDSFIDEGVLPGVGDPCSNQTGVCAGGVLECTGGALKCNKSPSPEVCDGLDNNCNGMTDEGDPGGGGKCGTDVGECVAGVYRCQNGMIECVGFDDHTTDAEVCDGKDNDCDGNFDENIGSLGTCGMTDVGECQTAPKQCIGGVPLCDPTQVIGPVFEKCNGKDDDCDGQTDEVFDLSTDVNHCTMCNNQCQPKSKTCINTTNSTDGASCTSDADCAGGSCVVNSQPRCNNGCTFQCNVGFKDIDGMAANGCEYHCFATGAEECDGVDNDCDGTVDEDLVAPPICLAGGECGVTAPVAQCTGSGGWTCTYPGDVQFPETKCDGKNNDCDANTDEGQPNLDQACDNGQVGVCKTTGVYICDPNNLDGPAICNAPANGTPPSAEACDGKDNDCDNKIDEGGDTGNLIGQEWVSIGGGKQMMKYEASRPDATASDPGTRNAIACSKPDVLPWTNVTYPQALAACQAIGATLCDESTWHRACSVITGNTYPLATNGSGLLIEAEDYSGIGYATGGTPSATRSWVPDYTAGFSSISAMEATPNTGATVARANAVAQSPRLDYLINFTATGNYHVWVRMYSNKSDDNQVHIGVGVTTPVTPTVSLSTSSNGSWQWRDAGTFNVPATGNRTVSIYMGDDGVKIDQIYLRTGNSSPPNTIASKGNKWAFATNPNSYAGNETTCNGDDYDTSPAPGDQDDIIATKSLANCRSTIGTGVFDMSGNVKEWTLAHAPGENPIRGGASNNTGEGISCPLNFTLANDTFFFPNIGFRCCR